MSGITGEEHLEYRPYFEMQGYSVVQVVSARPIRLSRAEQQAATRESLLRGAETVFARLGYGGASIDLIAAEAGYSKGAVFSNFASKEALFLELLRVYMERDMAELKKIVSLAPTQLFDALSNWLKTMHADASCPQLVVELQLHARRSPEFAAKYYALQESHTRTLALILETYFKAHSRAIPIDATDLASCLTALAHGISLQHPVGKPGTSDEAGRIIDELLGVLIQR